MHSRQTASPSLTGILLAIFATLVWSGNFVVARGVATRVPPVTLAFFRWFSASLFLLPLVASSLRQQWKLVRGHWKLIFWVGLFGIALFNTFLYVAGHTTPAINLALLGTTSSPVMSIILAAIFLGEVIRPLRIFGLLVCIAGILLLMSGGHWENLKQFRFSPGDGWILTAAFCFAIYNILVRRKPASLGNKHFLFFSFTLGTILLLPAWIYEAQVTAPVQWDLSLVLIVIYLGLGASVISYLCWNAAIARLGAGRTALFGNLIPIFSTIEAVLILGEPFTWVHAISGILVIGGLIIANLKRSNAALKPLPEN